MLVFIFVFVFVLILVLVLLLLVLVYVLLFIAEYIGVFPNNVLVLNDDEYDDKLDV